MHFTASVVERTDQEPGVDERLPLFPRKTIDRDAALVAQLRVKLGTVKSRVHRARLFLRRRLAGYMGASLDGARLQTPSTSAGLPWASYA
jgi:hypothetical protein